MQGTVILDFSILYDCDSFGISHYVDGHFRRTFTNIHLHFKNNFMEKTQNFQNFQKGGGGAGGAHGVEG